MSGGLPIVPGGITSTIAIAQGDLELNNFEALEHVTVRVWITHDSRGDVEVEITSPNGITSVLAARRRLDADKDGYPGWRFMSVKHWSVVICHLLAIRVLTPLEGARIRAVLGQFVSPILVPRVARAISSAGSSPSLVRRSTRPSHANTNFSYSKKSSPPFQTPMAHQQPRIPAPRRKYTRSRQNIYLGTMARPKAKRLSQHLVMDIHQRAPLRVGRWCPQLTKAGSPICPP